MLTNLRTYRMALELHRECLKITVESYLRDQLKRASSSVVLNISEGSANQLRKIEQDSIGLH